MIALLIMHGDILTHTQFLKTSVNLSFQPPSYILLLPLTVRLVGVCTQGSISYPFSLHPSLCLLSKVPRLAPGAETRGSFPPLPAWILWGIQCSWTLSPRRAALSFQTETRGFLPTSLASSTLLLQWFFSYCLHHLSWFLISKTWIDSYSKRYKDNVKENCGKINRT